MNRKEAFIHMIQGCSIGAIKDREKGDYYIGCFQCEKPVKIKSGMTIFNRTLFSRIKTRVREKGTPNC